MLRDNGVKPIYLSVQFIVMSLATILCFGCAWFYVNYYDNWIIDASFYKGLYGNFWQKAYDEALVLKTFIVPLTLTFLFVGIALLAIDLKMVIDYRTFGEGTEEIVYEIPKRIVIKKIYKGISKNSMRKSIEMPKPQYITALIANTKDLVKDDEKVKVKRHERKADHKAR